MEFLANLPTPVGATQTRKPRNDSALQLSDASLASFTLAGDTPVRAVIRRSNAIPPYGNRHGWVPRVPEDFGNDGGAFPECHVSQYPRGMGRPGVTTSQAVVSLQIDNNGKVAYDAVIKQGLSDRREIFTQPEHARAAWSKADLLCKPPEEEIQATEEETRKALERVAGEKAASGPLATLAAQKRKTEFIRYTPSNQTAGHNASCSQRVIQMAEAPVDPLEPPRFRHRRVPAKPPSPPPPILRSPPRKPTAADQAAWRVPPCVSNWKNQRGYTVPLDKRLQADGRSLQEHSVSSKFAVLSEALYIAERCARDEIRMRNELLKQKRQMEEEQREKQLRDLAAAARAERAAMGTAASVIAPSVGALSAAPSRAETLRTTAVHPPDSPRSEASSRASGPAPVPGRRYRSPSPDDRLDAAARARLQVDRERKREIEREMRLARAGRKRQKRDDDRDISEKIALGQAKPTRVEGLFDARLFHRESGMDSGFAGGDDEREDAVYEAS